MEKTKIEEYRDSINNISTIDDIVAVLQPLTKIVNGTHATYCTVNGYTIGWSVCVESGKETVYILQGQELIHYVVMDKKELSKEVINFILDDILKFDTDTFYRYYFKTHGYETLLECCKSKTVKKIINEFIVNGCLMKNIFVSEKYNSMTISGIKRNFTDYEYNIINCTKADVLELIELTHIKPIINKKVDISGGYVAPTRLPYYGVSNSSISNAITEYKNDRQSDIWPSGYQYNEPIKYQTPPGAFLDESVRIFDEEELQVDIKDIISMYGFVDYMDPNTFRIYHIPEAKYDSETDTTEIPVSLDNSVIGVVKLSGDIREEN